MSFKICAHCNKYGARKKCDACRKIRYCSRSCQIADWVYHRKECKDWKIGNYPSEINTTDGALLQEIYTEFDRYGIEPNIEQVETAIRRYQGYSSYDLWRYTKLVRPD